MFVQIQAALYLCSVTMGTCIKKMVIVRLNLDSSAPFTDLLHSEFFLKTIDSF